MASDRRARTFDAIVRVVRELLENKGYDAVRLRLVAKRARVSLTTIYKYFPTRDDLIVTAVGQWMQENCYSRLTDPPRDASLYEGQLWFFRRMFEAWERSPRMLEAYQRASSGPGGERLQLQGLAAVDPVGRSFLENVDPDYAKDIGLIMGNMVCGVIQRCVIGEIPVTDIMPVIERTLFRLTTDNAAAAAGEPPRSRRTTRRGERSG